MSGRRPHPAFFTSVKAEEGRFGKVPKKGKGNH